MRKNILIVVCLVLAGAVGFIVFPRDPGPPASVGVDAKSARVLIPEGVTLRLYPDKARYFLGENILFHYEVRNESSKRCDIDTRGDRWDGEGRAEWFVVTARDEQGEALEDPRPEFRDFFVTKPRPTVLEPHSSFHDSIALMHYRVPRKPGKYTVRVWNDLGWGADHEPSKEGKKARRNVAEDDPRWVTAEVEIVIPSGEEAARIAEEMTRERDTEDFEHTKKIPPYPDASCLRYDIYLPALKELADKGNTKAFVGLSGIETPEVTGYMIDKLTDANPQVAQAAFVALQKRMPMPSYPNRFDLFGGYMDGESNAKKVEAAWRDDMAPRVLELARAAINSPNPDYSFQGSSDRGARLIASIGTRDDLPRVTHAMDRCIKSASTDAKESNATNPRGFHALCDAAEALIFRGAKPVDPPQNDGEIAVLLISALRMPWNKTPALDLGERLKEWMNHPSPCIQSLAWLALPDNFAPWVKEAIQQKIKSQNPELRKCALFAIDKSKDPSWIGLLLDLIRNDPNGDIAHASSDSSLRLGGKRDEVCLAWADRFEAAPLESMSDYLDGATQLDRLMGIEESFYFYRGSTTPPAAEKRAALRAWWVTFIKANQDAIRSGKKFTREEVNVPSGLNPYG